MKLLKNIFSKFLKYHHKDKNIVPDDMKQIFIDFWGHGGKEIMEAYLEYIKIASRRKTMKTSSVQIVFFHDAEKMLKPFQDCWAEFETGKTTAQIISDKKLKEQILKNRRETGKRGYE